MSNPTFDNVFWARIEFRAYRQHYKRMTDAEIAADVRESMERMDDLEGDGSSFGALCVRAAFERSNKRAEIYKKNAMARWGKGDANGIEYGADGHGGIGRGLQPADGCDDGQSAEPGKGELGTAEEVGTVRELDGDRVVVAERNKGQGQASSSIAEVPGNGGDVERGPEKAGRVQGRDNQESGSGNRNPADAPEPRKRPPSNNGTLNVLVMDATGCGDVDSGNGRGVGAVVDKKKSRVSLPPVPKELIDRDPDIVEAWAGFVEMRKAKKAKLTVKAAELIFAKLSKASALPSQVLNLSTERGYTGIYPDKPGTSLAVAPGSMDADAITAWGWFPELSRGRSSPVQFMTAWTELGSNRPSMDVLRAGLDSWAKSDKWARDGGKWIEGAHKWLSRMQWLNPQRSQLEMAIDDAKKTSEHFM